MKITNWIILALTAGSLAFATGCSKSDDAKARNEMGVVIEMPKLRQACKDVASPAVQSSLSQAELGLRYGEYNKSLQELEKIAGSPDLNDQQKKLVGEVSEQIKQLAAKATANK